MLVDTKTEHYKFTQHKQCEFFPCHKVKNLIVFFAIVPYICLKMNVGVILNTKTA